ncbi:sensor histidine kinase [Terriglobus tenax]|uniref:sensor histidine kinase n=1 Tax=Terriglobus tenax TaxID=1111115 RepID=UPI0021E01022|nr:ATP-binding protein [Terriglobus tenax]
MSPGTPTRKALTIVLGVCLLILFLGLAALNAFKLDFLDPSSTPQIFLFTALSTIAFLLFVVVLILLTRNLLKLYAEHRSRLLGSRLRARMVWGAVILSLLPIAFMFAFSYLLMNRAVERWFSQPVTQLRDDSNSIAVELSRYASANARAEAQAIANSLPASGGDLSTPLQEHEVTLQGGFAAVYRNNALLAAFQLPQEQNGKVVIKQLLPEGGTKASSAAELLQTALRSDDALYSVADKDFALGTAWVKPQGDIVVVGLPLPQGMSDTVGRIRSAADTYWTLFRTRRSIRNQYMLLLLMITGLALFASVWLGLHLSRQVTRPVEALADAMEEIATGNYARRVEASATEELGELVRSFNHMAADLQSSRAQITESTLQISLANSALEARRKELETMLQTIPNGVAMLDIHQRVLLANRAFSEMLDPGGQRTFTGLQVSTFVPADHMPEFTRLFQRSHRMGSASAEFEMLGLNLSATIALIESAEHDHRGYVLVLENATELLRAQRQSAWKEVARRVAHEIKNPLTPISLSAEQIHRHAGRIDTQMQEAGLESPSPAVIRRSSETILSAVESLRTLVDQFSSLAEFPMARPRPADLNTIVQNSLAMFAGRTQAVKIRQDLTNSLPLVLADPEALKRALSNLIDNALEAMQNQLLRELHISTALLPSGMLELVVEDTGTGVTDEMRERLFLPYFSTKQRGTGLGLAIAAKIVQEHHGSIRAESATPVGARFILELPVASEIDVHGTTSDAVNIQPST